jgi:large subunit ribosomal protein L10
MPLTRQQKEELVESYREQITSAPNVYLLDYKGISVNEVNELRNKVRETGASYTVVKNRLALQAIEETPMADLADQFQGPVAVAYCVDDPVSLAKALTDFAKDVPAIEFKAGLMDGRVVSGDQLKEIAKLPSREELIAKLLFLLQSPVQRFVRTLAALGPQSLVTALGQVAGKKE